MARLLCKWVSDAEPEGREDPGEAGKRLASVARLFNQMSRSDSFHAYAGIWKSFADEHGLSDMATLASLGYELPKRSFWASFRAGVWLAVHQMVTFSRARGKE